MTTQVEGVLDLGFMDTSLWDFVSPDDHSALIQTFVDESKLVGERCCLGCASAKEKSAVTSFLLATGSVHMQIQEGDSNGLQQNLVKICMSSKSIPTEAHQPLMPAKVSPPCNNTSVLAARNEADSSDDEGGHIDETDCDPLLLEVSTEEQGTEGIDIGRLEHQVENAVPAELSPLPRSSVYPSQKKSMVGADETVIEKLERAGHLRHRKDKEANEMEQRGIQNLIDHNERSMIVCNTADLQMKEVRINLRKIDKMTQSEHCSSFRDVQRCSDNMFVKQELDCEVHDGENGELVLSSLLQQLRNILPHGSQEQHDALDQDLDSSVTIGTKSSKTNEQTFDVSQEVGKKNICAGADHATEEVLGQDSELEGVQTSQELQNPQSHYRTALGTLKNQCNICQKVFSTENSLKIHINAVHLKLDKYPCEECGRVFYIKAKLTQHMKRMHSNVREWKCDQCPKTGSYKSDLQAHKKYAHAIDKTRGYRPRRNRIMNRCKGGRKKTQSCTVKWNKSQPESSVTTGTDTVGDRGRIEEESNDAGTYANQALEEDDVSSKDARAGEDEVEDVQTNNTDDKTICNSGQIGEESDDAGTCADQAVEEDDVSTTDAHVEVEDVLAIKNLQNPQSPCRTALSTLKNQCDICQKVFRVENALKIHINAVHLKRDKYPCEECGRVFYIKSKLTQHVKRMHSNEREWKCDQCPKTCSYKTDLQTHKKYAHTPDKTCVYRPRKNRIVNKNESGKSSAAKKNENQPESSVTMMIGTKDKTVADRGQIGEENGDGGMCADQAVEEDDVSTTDAGEVEDLQAIKNLQNPPPPCKRTLRTCKNQCNICGRVFPFNRSLKIHMNAVHLKANKYPCEECGRVFYIKARLTKHVKRMHSNVREWKCDQCPKTCSYKTDLQAHKKYAHTPDKTCVYRPRMNRILYRYESGRKRSKCSAVKENENQPESSVTMAIGTNDTTVGDSVQCPKLFSLNSDLTGSTGRRENLLKMKKNQSSTGKTLCHICQQIFSCGKALKYHINSQHSEENQFPCEDCGRVFYNQKNMFRHMKRMHSKVKDWKCGLCPKAYSFETDLNRHTQSVHLPPIHPTSQNRYSQNLYKCDQCKKKYSRKGLKNHACPFSDNFGKYPCNQCDKKFSARDNLMRHVKRMHSRVREWKCDECPKDFSFECDLQHHKRYVHSELEKHLCDLCGTTFKSKSSLAKHQLSHNAEPKYECSVCGERFSFFPELSQHKLKHKEGRLFSCERCGKCFTSRQKLQRHTNMHDNILPYKCSYCEKAFGTRAARKNHSERVHLKMYRHACKLCHRRFILASLLKRHLESNHGITVQREDANSDETSMHPAAAEHGDYLLQHVPKCPSVNREECLQLGSACKYIMP